VAGTLPPVLLRRGKPRRRLLVQQRLGLAVRQEF